MTRLRLIILGFGLLVIAFLLILPDVDPPDAAGAEATSATLMVRWQVPTPAVRKIRKISKFRPKSITNFSSLETLLKSVKFVHPDFHSSLTLLCLLRC
jgi:hypothetical protein